MITRAQIERSCAEAGAATSSDSSYDGVDASNVSVTNTDNDAAGITVTPTFGLTTTEAGGTATFTVVLASQPTADVTIAVARKRRTDVRRLGRQLRRLLPGRVDVVDGPCPERLRRVVVATFLGLGESGLCTMAATSDH